MPRYPTKHSFGWKPSLPDHQDYQYSAPYEILKALPPSVDLRPQCSPVLQQGPLGACVSNAVAGGLQFLQMKQNIASFVASRLFIYYNGRMLEGTVNSDSGLSVRDGIKSVNNMAFHQKLTGHMISRNSPCIRHRSAMQMQIGIEYYGTSVFSRTSCKCWGALPLAISF